jgi:hypothetical protein
VNVASSRTQVWEMLLRFSVKFQGVFPIAFLVFSWWGDLFVVFRIFSIQHSAFSITRTDKGLGTFTEQGGEEGAVIKFMVTSLVCHSVVGP